MNNCKEWIFPCQSTENTVGDKNRMNTHTCLGIELGSTRIKAVLTDRHHRIIAQGAFDWENSLTKEGYWTYALSEKECSLRVPYR